MCETEDGDGGGDDTNLSTTTRGLVDSERDAVVKTDDLRRVERLSAVVAPLIAELTATMVLDSLSVRSEG